VDGLNYKWV